MAKASALFVLAFAVVLAHTAVASCYDRDASGRQMRFQLRGAEAFDTRTGLTASLFGRHVLERQTGLRR